MHENSPRGRFLGGDQREIADGVLCVRLLVVNVFIVRTPGSWVLVDAGFSGYGRRIRDAARRFVGSDAPPAAIVVTHGHFDHVGSLRELLDVWPSPVLAHPLERPYLTGASAYPPPDPLVGGGLVTLVSRLFPTAPIDVGDRLRAVAGGSAPEVPEWRLVHTPGHTAGHLALYRERDRTLLAGDALTTVRTESAAALFTQPCELHGPPAYFTQDWQAAGESVGRLAALEPETLGAGHGRPWRGADMRRQLRDLAAHFQEREVPAFGRYSQQPAVADQRGVVTVPPDPLPKVVAGAMMAAGVAWGLAQKRRERKV